MDLTPLLPASAVAIALATTLALSLVRRHAASAFVAPLAGLVPSLMAWGVLRAPLGVQYWGAALDFFVGFVLVVLAAAVQVGVIAVLAWAPLRRAPHCEILVAGGACVLAVAVLATSAFRAPKDHPLFASDDCVAGRAAGGTSSGNRPVFERDGVTVASVYEPRARSGDPAGLQPIVGPFDCVADIEAHGVARRQTLGPATQASGFVVCPEIEVLSCARAKIVVVEGSAYRTEDLSPTACRLAGNLASFGPPRGYLALALVGACAALLALAAAIRALRAPRAAVEGPRASPYRAATLAQAPIENAGEGRLAFAAVVLAFAGAAPLATVLAVG